MTTKKPDASLEALLECQENVQEALLQKENVVGVGIGHKVTQGRSTGEPCITAFVSRKLPSDGLKKEQMIERDLDGFKTDVIETGVIFAGAGAMTETMPEVPPVSLAAGALVLAKRVRPAKGGYSVGHYKITAGTYATAVYDLGAFPGMPQRTYVLSNNHVLANSNDARIGDPILQPGPYDGGTLADTIARLSRFVPIRFDGKPNYVDAAIAEGSFDTLDREVYWIGHPKGIAATTIGEVVQKTGRTTNYTTGKVQTVNATVNVNYGGSRVARFERQIMTTNMSAGGDSGSLLLNLNGAAVGLLFAGSASVTIFNPIAYVVQLLGVKIG